MVPLAALEGREGGKREVQGLTGPHLPTPPQSPPLPPPHSLKRSSELV